MKNELIGGSTLRSYIEPGWRTSELTWRYGLARRQRRLTEMTRHDATRTARRGRTSTIHLPTAFNWRSIKATHRVPGSGSFAGGPFLCAQCTRAPWESRSTLAIRSASFIASGALAPRGHSGSRVNSSDDKCRWNIAIKICLRIIIAGKDLFTFRCSSRSRTGKTASWKNAIAATPRPPAAAFLQLDVRGSVAAYTR